MICAAGIFGGGIVDSLSTVVIRQEFLDLPVVDLGADTEFEVFLGNGVPVLIVSVSVYLLGTR